MTWLVLGAGTSGLGAVALLRAKGQEVVVSDGGRVANERRQELAQLGVTLKEDACELSHLAGIDQGLIVSPGIAFDHPLLLAAQSRGLPLVTEIDLALAHYRGRLAAVTGTNGKSTTVAMLGYLLTAAGLRAAVAGNIGTPPSRLLAQGEAPTALVLELSSYQLALSNRVAPEVAILTNLTPDHLARHGTLAAYLTAKWRIFAQQGPQDTALVAPEAAALAAELSLPQPRSQLLLLTPELCRQVFPSPTPEAELPHNQMNATASILAAAAILRRPWQEVKPLLTGFRGLAHRCEKIGTIDSRPVFNDSKATNVASTLVALGGQSQPVVLLLGGQGKGESFAPFAQHASRLGKVIAFGAAAPQITTDLAGLCPLVSYPTLKAAMAGLEQELRGFPLPLLFSPACASFDEFQNFEDRGEYFRRAVAPLLDPLA